MDPSATTNELREMGRGPAVSPTACPACGGGRTNRARTFRAQSPTFAGCELWHCSECTFFFAHPMPSREALRRYNESYFASAHGGVDVAQRARPFHSAINRLRVEHVEHARRREGVSVYRVLEVGPGLGDFAAHWRRLHPNTEYHVVESDPSCHAALTAQGVRVYTDVAELAPSEREYDLLVMSHVLEHTSDPAGVLATLVPRLRSGALTFIEVPCRDFEHKSREEPHLLFFDREPMRRLLSRSDVRPIAITYHGVDLDLLKRGRFTRPSLLRRVFDRCRAVTDEVGLLPVPLSLRVVEDPAGRAAVRRFEAHLEKRVPAWWLRAIGRVDE